MPIVFESQLFNGGQAQVTDWPLPDRKVQARTNLTFIGGRDFPLIGKWLAFSGAVTLPAFDVSGSFEAQAAFTGEAVLPSLTATGSFIASNFYSGAVRLPAIEASGTYLAGSAFSGDVELPAFDVSGIFGTFTYSGSVTLPTLIASGRFEPDIVQTYRGWPVNLKNMGLTEYTNFNFNSMTKFNGEYLAAGATGLVALSGDDDRGTQIDWRIRLGLTDFGIEQLKRLEEAFMTYRSEGDATFRVIIDGGQTYEYTLVATGNRGMATNRTKIGKGVKSNFWCFEVESINGAAIEIQDMTLHPVVLARKIGRPPDTGVFTGRVRLPMLQASGQF